MPFGRFALLGDPVMNAPAGLPSLAPIPRRPKPDRGARGRAAPKRVLTTVEVQSFDPVACEMITETTQAYTRILPPVLVALPEPLRKAATVYARAYEDVEAGGASDPAASGLEGGASVHKEGRQFLAVKQVRFLRDLEAAIGPEVVFLGCRSDGSPVAVTHLAIMQAIAVDGLSVASLLGGLRLARSLPRRKAVTAAFLASVEAMALHLGLIEETEKQPKGEKMS